MYNRTQSELKTELEVRLRDPDNERWSEPEIYAAINSALMEWAPRVKIPFLYTITGGWAANEREYDLPYYVSRPIDPQFKTTYGSHDFWSAVPAYTLHARDGGILAIVLGYLPSASDGRVIFWAPNSPTPTTISSQSGSIDSDDTSITVVTTALVGMNGYIKVEDEWIQYSGAVRSGSNTVLSNLVRGCMGTTATSHSAATVEWGVVVHRPDLYEQMMHHCLVFLHSLFNQNASNTKKDLHQWNMRWESPMAKDFWKTYTPWRSPKMRVARLPTADVYPPGYGRDLWWQDDIYDNMW